MHRVAVLGTGLMSAGMTHSMLRAGLDVTVWNRSPERAAPLAADGAHVAGTVAEAVAGEDAVVTMLWDGGSVADVIGADPALIEVVAQQFRKAAGSGHGEQDMAAVYHAFLP
jgi:3-hydroxyisobutyrate dehydrogenase